MNGRKKIQRPCCTSIHMFLSGKKIEKFTSCDFSRSTNVEILYAHNNLLINVDNLSLLQNLTHVYLQWNRINSIKNLCNLPCLQNLYLGYNCISIVEGLKGMPNLKLLHIQKQKFASEGLTLKFHVESLQNISKSLTVLNVAGNHLTSLNKLICLLELEHLNVSDNMLADKEETCSVLSQWKNLQNLDIRENPMMWTNGRIKYHIISMCQNLEVLNAKPIPRNTRSFLRALRRVQNQREKLEGITKKYAQLSPETQSSSHQVPTEVREIVSRSVTLNRRADNVEKS